MLPASTAFPPAFDLQILLSLGMVLVLCSSLHSLLLWLGHPREAGLGHLLAASALQGLALLGHLARVALATPGWSPAAVNVLLLPAAVYGLWALRRYAGLAARPRRREWLTLGAWACLALVFHATGLAAPVLLVLLALGSSLELRRLAQKEGGQAPALACEGLALVLALAAIASGLPSAFFAALRGAEAAQARAWFAFGVLGTQQLFTFLLAQVQGQRIRHRLEALKRTDVLTGLASAEGFRGRLERAVGRALRTGRVSSILVLELDGYDTLVAAHGPAPVKYILEAFATTLDQTLREADYTGRLEGCRFTALLHQTQPTEALLAAERLRSAWANHPLPLTLPQTLPRGPSIHHPTLSGGVASTREPIQDAQGLVDLALGRMMSVRLDGGDNLVGEPLPG